jgi:hypothetical protein
MTARTASHLIGGASILLHPRRAGPPGPRKPLDTRREAAQKPCPAARSAATRRRNAPLAEGFARAA